MSVFDFFKKKNVLEGEYGEKNSEDNKELDKVDENTSIAWDTLSFGVVGETEISETPFVPKERKTPWLSSQNENNVYIEKSSNSELSLETCGQQEVKQRSPVSAYTSGTYSASTTLHNEKNSVLLPTDYSKYVYPNSAILTETDNVISQEDSVYREKLEAVFQNYRIKAQIMTVLQTDVAITFGVAPNPGVRINNITSYKDEYGLALGGKIEYEIPLKGTSYLGIHVLKENKTGISLRKIIESNEYKNSKARIPLLMGVLTSGKFMIEDLDSIGHLLIAGGTGSGKSVFLDSLILGMLYGRSPRDIKFIFIDTNVLNLSIYNNIPSMLIPVITDTRKAIAALLWCSHEVDIRTEKMMGSACKDIDDYNEKSLGEKIPHIVLVVDEIAPLIEVENGIDTLLMLAMTGKAAGVHMILSTQKISSRSALRRIKECIHARVAFSVVSESESKSIIDMPGAERLSAPGEMLYRKPGQNAPIHIQGANTKSEDVSKTVEFIRENNSFAVNKESVTAGQNTSIAPLSESEYDEYLIEAGRLVIEKDDNASIGMLQRAFKIGFNRAARIMDQLCELGVVGEAEGIKPRRILMSLEEFESLMNQIRI